MAQSPMKKQNQLMANAHYGYISSNMMGLVQTKILFSVYDFEWVAWYLFVERETATNVSPPPNWGKYTVFGTPWGGGKPFQPFKPLRVDELADGNGPWYGPAYKSAAMPVWPPGGQHPGLRPYYGYASALGLLSVGRPDKSNQLVMGLTVFLERPQNLELMLNSRSPLALPARFERGTVFKMGPAEVWSPGPLSERRFHFAMIDA